jgi:hypothetical protein
VARDLTPTFVKVRQLSPHLRGLFIQLKPLIRVSQTGLPALSKTLHELKPVLADLDPFLANFNPVVRYLNAYRANVGDFLSNPPAALGDTLPQSFAQGAGNPAPHMLRQVGYLSSESLAIYPDRPATNRGNGYLQPGALTSYDAASKGIFPEWDCNNTGVGERSAPAPHPSGSSDLSAAPCWVAPPFAAEFGGKHAPTIFADP